MKRTLKILSLCLLALSLFSFKPVETDAFAIMTFETDIIDYGNIVQNSDGTRTFTFQNTGNAPLLITKVNTTCGCTVPKYSKTPILPGENGELQINYDTKRLGAFVKTITVVSNTKEGNKRLKIKGTVVPESK